MTEVRLTYNEWQAITFLYNPRIRGKTAKPTTLRREIGCIGLCALGLAESEEGGGNLIYYKLTRDGIALMEGLLVERDA